MKFYIVKVTKFGLEILVDRLRADSPEEAEAVAKIAVRDRFGDRQWRIVRVRKDRWRNWNIPRRRARRGLTPRVQVTI